MASRHSRSSGFFRVLCALFAVAAATQAAAHAAPLASTGNAGGPGAPTDGPLLVFAAASLADVLDEINRAYSARSGIDVRASYAASSVLARQIESGAPADVFIGADREWMDYLQERHLLRDGSRRDLLGNTLVLVGPAGGTLQLKIAPGVDLTGALGSGRLAIGDPDSVPAGMYAQAALTRLGVWDHVKDRLARADNVRTALEYVARGESPLGIVYGTDARAEKRVRVVGVFPADTHPPITYPVALTAGAHRGAEHYSEFLRGDTARQIFTRRGFVVLAAGGAR
jgi:molybdate transport system substrate-binding protein